MRLINDTEIKNNIDMDTYNKKNFEDNIVNYKKIYALYYLVLCKYIDSVYDTSKIDIMINDSDLYIGSLEDKNKNIYFKTSGLNSDFVYIRNYLNIERLDQSDIDVFLNRVKENNYEIDDTLLKIVERTYKTVIASNTDSKNVFYGPSSLDFKFNNNSLVLFINYWKNTMDFKGEDYIKISNSQNLFFDLLCDEISDYYSDKLNVSVEVKYYKGAVSTR